MASPSHCVARIDSTPTGDVVVRVIAAGLRRRVAERLADEHAREGRAIAVVASPALRSVAIRGAFGFAVADVRRHVATLRIAQWLAALRAHGLVRLDAPGDSRIQPVPPAWLRDPVLLEALGVVLTPAPPAAADAWMPDEDWLACAPDDSIAQLLDDAPRHVFLAWACDLPPDALRPLCVPLLQHGPGDDGAWRLGTWRRPVFRDAFSLGEAVVITAGPTPPRAEWRPVSADGTWSLAGPPDAARDPAWRWRGDQRLDRLLRVVPSVVESVLMHAACARGLTGAAMERELAEVAALRRAFERVWDRRERALTAELLQRTGTAGVPAPRLVHARWLHGAGPSAITTHRREALALWPALAGDLADGTLPAAAQAVDAGEPLLPALAADLRIAPWAARRLLRLLQGARLPAELGDVPRLAALVQSAGPHAPPLRPADLPALAAWLRYVPSAPGEPFVHLLMRALGREAARAGWAHAGDAIDADDDGGFQLLAWWHDLQANVADVLRRADGVPPDADRIDAVLGAWLADTSLTEALRLASGWVAFLWRRDEHTAPVAELAVAPPFAAFVLPGGVHVAPLSSLDALREEGIAMRHCVASHWPAVARADRLIVALRDPTGQRVTVSLRCEPDGRWHAVESRGPANVALPEDGALAAAVDELVARLDTGTLLPPDLAAHYRERAASSPPRAGDYAVAGQCLLSRLPPALGGVALRWMPGAGALERRVAAVAAKLESGRGVRTSAECDAAVAPARCAK